MKATVMLCALIAGCYLSSADNAAAQESTPSKARSSGKAEKAAPSKLLLSPAVAQQHGQATPGQDRPGYLYCVCQGAQVGWHGCFDLAESGAFTYCLGDYGFREQVKYLGEASGYYFFQEQDYPTWLWAFSVDASSADNFIVYGTLGSEDQFTFFGYASRCSIAP